MRECTVTHCHVPLMLCECSRVLVESQMCGMLEVSSCMKYEVCAPQSHRKVVYYRRHHCCCQQQAHSTHVLNSCTAAGRMPSCGSMCGLQMLSIPSKSLFFSISEICMLGEPMCIFFCRSTVE
jgi:hypothetical protein